MPYGRTTLGIACFAAVKLAGYSWMGWNINRSEGVSRPHPLLVGSVRTAIGIAAGVSYGWSVDHFAIGNQGVAFYVGLLPIRIVEWLFLLWLFNGDRPHVGHNRTRHPVGGVLLSYLLDIPAMLTAFVVPGGFWIC